MESWKIQSNQIIIRKGIWKTLITDNAIKGKRQLAREAMYDQPKPSTEETDKLPTKNLHNKNICIPFFDKSYCSQRKKMTVHVLIDNRLFY